MDEMSQQTTLIENEKKHEIHVENYDGPLDLLWELIKKAKIDITEISISSITEQYIEFLRLMETLNVKVAIEFIWMASELLYYKSVALLPTETIDDEYFVPPLPPELIQKLLEYKKFQKASRDLKMKFLIQSGSFSREYNTIPEEIGEPDRYIDVSLFDLLKAFTEVLESQRKIDIEEIIFDEILVSDRIEHIESMLKENEVLIFNDIFSSEPRTEEVVATFLAMLEMTKTGVIKIIQSRIFGDIRLIKC